MAGAEPVDGVPADAEVRVDDIDSWRELISSAFVDVHVDSQDEDFSATLRSQVCEGVVLSRIRAAPHRSRRTVRRIRETETEHYMLCVQLTGTGTVTQSGRSARLEPGDITMFATHQPYDLAFDEDFECLAVMVPTSAVAVTPRSMHELAAVRVAHDEPLAGILVDFLDRLESDLRLLDEPVRQRLVGNAVDLVDTLWGDQLHRMENESVKPSAIPRDVLRYIELHLPDHTLSPAAIARAHYISVRKLHALFAEEDLTVASWIRQRRLERCRDDLCRPELGHLSISEIAARWGIVNPQHFSQLFRTAYGMTATAYRSAMTAALYGEDRPADASRIAG